LGQRVGIAAVLLAAALATGSAAVAPDVAGPQPPSHPAATTPAAVSPDPPAETQFKNIRVLTGTDFEDYREVGGVKVPFLVKTSFLDDDHLGTTRKLNEVRHNAPPVGSD
jgi:hypothetical protein